jgi:hypothetical protein
VEAERKIQEAAAEEDRERLEEERKLQEAQAREAAKVEKKRLDQKYETIKTGIPENIQATRQKGGDLLQLINSEASKIINTKDIAFSENIPFLNHNRKLEFEKFKAIEPGLLIDLLTEKNKLKNAVGLPLKQSSSSQFAVPKNISVSDIDSIKRSMNKVLPYILYYRLIENVIYFYRISPKGEKFKDGKDKVTEQIAEDRANKEGQDFIDLLRSKINKVKIEFDHDSSYTKQIIKIIEEDIREIKEKNKDINGANKFFTNPDTTTTKFAFSNTHIVPITKITILEKIKDIISNPLPEAAPARPQSPQVAGNKTKSKKSARKSNGTRKIH